jgi:hypothetical protein
MVAKSTSIGTVNPLESWRRCYATSILTWPADAARAVAVWCSNAIDATLSSAP